MAELKDRAYWNRRALIAEANEAISEGRLADLRERSTQAIAQAVRVANTAKELLEESQDSSDSIEMENAELKKQIKRIKESLMNGSEVLSAFEDFLMSMSSDSESYKYIKRTLLRACHPDKHQKTDKTTQMALNKLFIIVNSIFGE